MCENEYGGVWRPPATAVTPSRDGRLCPMLGQRTLRCSANLNKEASIGPGGAEVDIMIPFEYLPVKLHSRYLSDLHLRLPVAVP